MSRRAAPHRGLDVHYGSEAPTDSATDGEAGGTDDEAARRPSKSQLKRESHSLQDLGEELVELGDERLAALAVPEPLRDAIVEFRRTRSHEGKRRQMQYIGKLMRSADEEALREAVASSKIGSARETLALHDAERWRAEFIADDAAMERWVHAHPDTDVQHLRSLVRAARRDAAGLPPEARQPKSFRELFRYIRAASVPG